MTSTGDQVCWEGAMKCVTTPHAVTRWVRQKCVPKIKKIDLFSEKLPLSSKHSFFGEEDVQSGSIFAEIHPFVQFVTHSRVGYFRKCLFQFRGKVQFWPLIARGKVFHSRAVHMNANLWLVHFYQAELWLVQPTRTPLPCMITAVADLSSTHSHENKVPHLDENFHSFERMMEVLPLSPPSTPSSTPKDMEVNENL